MFYIINSIINTICKCRPHEAQRPYADYSGTAIVVSHCEKNILLIILFSAFSFTKTEKSNIRYKINVHM